MERREQGPGKGGLSHRPIRRDIGRPRALLKPDFRNGSWPCKNGLTGLSILKPKLSRPQAATAAISGRIPRIFIARVRL
jgi:hypothetical protein